MYNNGDVVKAKTGIDGHIKKGTIGVIVDENFAHSSKGVCWQNMIFPGHNCNGNCVDGRGWYTRLSDMICIKEAK